ncbi:hypothetical protein IQ244_25160 [Nostoc sp. LEGE 06077]|uniref:hypothetical protein n=1 Tax=Nostoc sp. LEGE 06077 TaxID=915325 RepID=UPI0018812A73|nr:hypothetical protein [Nostoc sp. LEGE 06077]MBE9209722.1 hypothetical protein [Nostoc sp. LEGE 06077]
MQNSFTPHPETAASSPAIQQPPHPVYTRTTPPDIANTILSLRAHSNQALTSAVTVFLPLAPLLQELMNSPVGLSHHLESDPIFDLAITLQIAPAPTTVIAPWEFS